MISTTSTMSRAALVGALAMLLWGGASDSARASESEARAAIEQTLDEVLPVIHDAALTRDEKVERLTEIADRRFDLKRMTALILGRNRRKLTPDQRNEFLEEFKRHLTVTYADSLDRVSNERVELTGSRAETNGDVTVRSMIVGGNADGVKLDYRLRSKDGPWRVIDISVEGVSVAQNFRSQVQEIISAHGADRLIEILRDKNNEGTAAVTN